MSLQTMSYNQVIDASQVWLNSLTFMWKTEEGTIEWGYTYSIIA